MIVTVRSRTSWPSPLRPAAWLLGLLLLGLPLLRAQSVGGEYFLPGDAQAGMQAFSEKGCARCHSVLGEGGRSAPDLASSPAGYLSAAELLAAMWNHAPVMWEKMRLEGVTPPKFGQVEMTNLFAFLYSVRSLDEPGDLARGRRLLYEKRCLQCHAVAGQGGRVGPDLEKWASYRNPVSWIQTMWNHAPAMQQNLAARGLSWPKFRDTDMPDLIAYIRTLAPPPGRRVYLRPADPQAGQRLFREKGCAHCHAVRGVGGSRGPDLGNRLLPRTLGQFAGRMWNHAPAMWAAMQAQAISRPQFSNKEMADLIAYLFAERYFEMTGNAERGRRIYEEKGCARCHTVGGRGGVGPDLAHGREGVAPVTLATSLWNHGPMMLQAFREQQLSWPRFQPGEIVDLMEFLSRAQPARLQAKEQK